MKILVCEDDDVIACVIRIKLTRDNLGEVVIARDGREAMAMLQTEKFDLIVTDIHMPFNSGLEVVAYAKQLGHHTPIIVLSAEELDETVANVLTMGVVNFVTKAFIPGDLSALVRQVLQPLTDSLVPSPTLSSRPFLPGERRM